MNITNNIWSDTHKKIDLLVMAYQKYAADEYNLFLRSVPDRKESKLNKFAALKGDDYLHREISVIPEKLNEILHNGLTDEEWKYFNSKEGSRWFAKKYQQYRASEKV